MMTNSQCRSSVLPPPYIPLSQKHPNCPPAHLRCFLISSARVTFSRPKPHGDRPPVSWPAKAPPFRYGCGTGVPMSLVPAARICALSETDLRSSASDEGPRSRATVTASGPVAAWGPRFEKERIYRIRRAPFSRRIHECWGRISSISTKSIVANSSRAPPARVFVRRP
jgi:hypothetical protein